MDVDAVLTDLATESQVLDALVAGLPDEAWAAPTPSPGWTIAHQIAHLRWTDQAALLAATEPDGFAAHLKEAADDPAGFVDRPAGVGARLPPADLLSGWRADRERLAAALRVVPAKTRLPWYGPPMSAASMATARLMETWAHGQDVADTLGVRREPTARLRHVAHLAIRTRDFAYLLNGLTAPAEEFRVELTGPDGDLWTWGPDDAAQRVTGEALGFALLATQRRHRADVDVKASGQQAEEWLGIIQAFAGPPGAGRAAGQFA